MLADLRIGVVRSVLVEFAAVAAVELRVDRQVQMALQYLDSAIERLERSSAMTDRQALAGALLSRCGVLRRANRVDDAVAAYDAVHERFRDDCDPVIARHTATALFQKAELLDADGDSGQALEAFRLLAEEYASTPDFDIYSLFRQALQHLSEDEQSSIRRNPAPLEPMRRARFLVESGTRDLGRSEIEGALRWFDEALALFGTSADGEDRIWAARALHNRGMALQQARRYPESSATFAEVVSEYKDDADSSLRGLVDSALINAAVSGMEAGRSVEALAFLDAALERLENATTMSERRSLANALYNRATVLRASGQTEDAVQAFDTTWARCGQDDDPSVCRYVALALYSS